MKASTAEIGALRVAEWQGQAATMGVPFHHVACAALRGRMRKDRGCAASEAWFSLSPNTRGILLAMATDRTTTTGVQWSDLTDKEKAEVGALARALVRELSGKAAALR